MGEQWIVDIKKEWSTLTPKEEKLAKIRRRCIFKVPKFMRDLNSNAYTPEVVSFGPYHHGKEHLKPMEAVKRRVLHYMLTEMMMTSIDKVVAALRKDVCVLKGAYTGLEGSQWTNDNSFLELMIVDGCCLLHILLVVNGLIDNYLDYKLIIEGPSETKLYYDDMLLQENQQDNKGPLHRSKLFNDMLLLENQVPLHVLQILLDLGKKKISAADLLHVLWPNRDIYIDPKKHSHILEATRTLMLGNGDFIYKNEGSTNLGNITELVEAGVKLECNDVESFRDISFKEGVLQLPSIPLNVFTESVLLNFVAFEHMYNIDTDVISFLVFMDRLIDTGNDVALLRREGIIKGWTGNDDDVALIFNRLVKRVPVLNRRKRSQGVEVDQKLIQYSRKRRNRWRASFLQTYMRNPWVMISLLVAFILLSLSILQTVYAVRSAYRPA